jgi:integrase
VTDALPVAIAPSLPAELAERLAQSAYEDRGTKQPATIRALRSASGAFTSWASDYGEIPLPAEPAAVARYVDHLAETKKAPATISQAVWAISSMHRDAGVADPTKTKAVVSAVKRARKQLGTRQKQAAPLLDDDVKMAIRAAGEKPSKAVLRDLALMMVMRDLLARRSEAVALDVAHVTFAKSKGDGSATVLIAKSKTDQTGQGEVRWLSPRTVTHLRRWLEAARIESGAIFRAVNKAGGVGDRLSPDDIPRLLRRAAVLAGVREPMAVSGHSCRVGMAQDLVENGAELPAVMQAGRWKSPTMPARYAENAEAKRGAVAQFYERRRG